MTHFLHEQIPPHQDFTRLRVKQTKLTEMNEK